ncbi:hypothetical protein CHS0354_036673 [Potamilus streckersoni]|uniref:Uncharacterized protein n=1 Tax=Potamilus streckersoni TaxID=2493646 RepID=A0AAE0TGH2_9BIVA|nr:hypothetical protein CHS0354_036673 [Potamilus streckersoni]
MNDESRVADLAYRDPLNEERWDYFSFRNLRHSSKLVDLNSKYFGRRENQNISNLNEVHRRFLKRQKRSLDGETIEFLGAVSHMKDIDLNNPGRYKIQKRQVQYPKDSSSHINDPKITESDTISSDRKQTHRDHTHSRHSNNAPQSSKKFEFGFQSGRITEHAAATGDKQNRHGTVHRHRHSGHSSRPLPDSSTNVMTEAEAAEQYASQKEDGYQNEDLQHFDARTDSNSNIHPDQTSSKHTNIQAASSQSYRQGFETFIQNLDVENAKSLYPFRMEDASDKHIPRLDDIPIYMQHVYLLLSKEDDKELMVGKMPTIRAVKLSPDQ